MSKEFVLKSDCRRDAKSTVGGPSPILMKFAPEVRLGPKQNLATPFWPKRPVRPAQGPLKWSFLSFFKNQFFGQIFILSKRRDMFARGFW